MHYKNLIIFVFLFSFINSLSVSENFVSIKSKSNLRAGPGKQYPIKWTLTLPNMPVKVLDKSPSYTKVELYDGTIGWIRNSTISEKEYRGGLQSV